MNHSAGPTAASTGQVSTKVPHVAPVAPPFHFLRLQSEIKGFYQNSQVKVLQSFEKQKIKSTKSAYIFHA